MTIRNWVKFFFNGLLIGGFVTAVLGLIVRWEFFSGYLAGRRNRAIYWCAFMDDFSWIYDECCCADGLFCLFDGSSIRCKYI